MLDRDRDRVTMECRGPVLDGVGWNGGSIEAVGGDSNEVALGTVLV